MRSGTKHSNKKWGLGALALLAVLVFSTRLAGAEKIAPEGCSFRRPDFAAPSCFPLETEHWRLSDGYGWRQDPLDGTESFHRGVDLACSGGTQILAAMDAVVAEAGRSESYGNFIRLLHAGGQETIYAHLQYLYVREGEVVARGEPLGTAGQTGRATGIHLHFELREQGVWQDPAGALGLLQ